MCLLGGWMTRNEAARYFKGLCYNDSEKNECSSLTACLWSFDPNPGFEKPSFFICIWNLKCVCVLERCQNVLTGIIFYLLYLTWLKALDRLTHLKYLGTAFVYNLLTLQHCEHVLHAVIWVLLQDQKGYRKLIRQGAVAINPCLQKMSKRHSERKNAYKSFEEWSAHKVT